jgi:lipoyl(octanoyl) transferase
MIHIHELGLQPYLPIWEKMKTFTSTRTSETPDQMWLLEHEPVFTQGQAGRPEHLLQTTNIPLVQSDRGGQITYHGPGQLVAYCMLDIKRRNLSVRTLVCKLEQTLINLLADLAIEARRQSGAPGVYVNEQKIASVGLRVKHGCSYHGIALNVNMDLSPFQTINPCGFSKLSITQIQDHVPTFSMQHVIPFWMKHFLLEFED